MHPSNTMNWEELLREVSASDYDGEEPVAPFWFGGDREMSDELTNLVLTGSKTATASLQIEWEINKEPLPKIGQRDVLLNWDNEFIGIIETIKMDLKPFKDVQPEFARLEGEGDLSLEYWRKVHWEYFDKVCFKYGIQISEDIPVVCQVFSMPYVEQMPRKKSKGAN